MQKMVQFRNILVHDYARIDPEIVVGILQHDVEDFRRFAREILDRLPKTLLEDDLFAEMRSAVQD